MKKLKRVISGVVAGSIAALPIFVPGCRSKPPVPAVDPEFDPSENEPVEVYGPPEWFEGDPVDSYDPEDNIVVTVYGPPSWFGIDEDVAEDPAEDPVHSPDPDLPTDPIVG